MSLDVLSNVKSITPAGVTLDYLTGNYTNATTGATNVFAGITTSASHVYLVEGFVQVYNATAAADVELRITAPTSSTVSGAYDAPGTTVAAQQILISSINTLQAVTTVTTRTTGCGVYFTAVVSSSTTTGTLTLGAAGVAGTTTVVGPGSWLRITDLTAINAIQN